MGRDRWYKDMVFYQIWPRSFKDGDGDGMGDLQGVYEKLNYIKSLGVDGIWFSPLYPSPGADCGYDISDYRDIAAEFGGMEWFKKVLEGAHARGMKVIMDLVVNHTSDEHEWFQKSRRRIAPYTDYYIWRKEKPDGNLPNNWDSVFEGKAWQWDELRQEYYLHLFAVKQPDLNMDNPLVRQEVKEILRFWLELGVDGFREDVITFISKKDGLPDDRLMPAARGIRHYNHGPHVHEYLEEFKRDVLDHYDCVTLAEAPMVSPRQALKYIDEKRGQMDMMIQFQSMCADCLYTDYAHTAFSLRRLKRVWDLWQRKLRGKAWNMLYLENHDHPRVISRYGSEQYREQSGKALAAAYLFQQGTPFVYQGQEIGMTNLRLPRLDMYVDVMLKNNCRIASKVLPQQAVLTMAQKSCRDSARTPMQWTGGPWAGFSETRPWFYVNENYRDVNVAVEEKDPDSLLNFYRELIAFRKSEPLVMDGEYKEHLKQSPNFYVYSRESGDRRLLVICSFADKETYFTAPEGFDLLAGRLVLKNYEMNLVINNSFTARPYELRVYIFE